MVRADFNPRSYRLWLLLAAQPRNAATLNPPPTIPVYGLQPALDHLIFLYDGTYEGCLSVIFETFRVRVTPDRIVAEDRYQDSLFDEPVRVETDEAWARRVERGIEQRSNERTVEMLRRCFLSEQEGVEMLIFHFVRSAVDSKVDVSRNFRDERIHRLHQLDRQMGREIHRMHAFVRFQRTRDDLYVAIVQPDFNVLPLLEEHFVARYPAQEWLIYDSRRRYGLYWDRHRAGFITLDAQQQERMSRLGDEAVTADETDYRRLWQTYFESVDIPERRNLKLHLQHVPRRYWKYLVEKW